MHPALERLPPVLARRVPVRRCRRDSVRRPRSGRGLGARVREAGGRVRHAAFTLNGPASADNQEHVYSMLTTSSILPPSEFPLFAAEKAVEPTARTPSTLRPARLRGREERRRGLAAAAQDDRPDREPTGADLSFKISYDTEPLYDYVIVEAHTVGEDDWTTLPDLNGHTYTDPASRADRLALGAPVHRPLPDRRHARERGVHRDRHDRRVERRDRATPAATRTGRSTSPTSPASRSRSRSPTSRTSRSPALACSSTTSP